MSTPFRSSSPEAKSLVRSFSDDIKDDTDNTLGQALVKQEARDDQADHTASQRYSEWTSLLQGLDESQTASLDEQRLRQSSQRLVVAWKKFVTKLNKKLPAEERISVSDPPNFALLSNAVSGAQASWQKRRDSSKVGRTHGKLASVVQSFDDYRELLKIIPSDDKYICLLTGSLSAFAKASINHEQTAEGINDALQLVCDSMEYWRRKMRVHSDNAFMKSYVIQLCVIIFEMYTDIFVEWSSSKWSRFLNSFDSEVFKKLVGQKVEQMRELAGRLEREANLSTEDRIHNDLVSRDDLARFQLSLEENLGKRLQNMLRQDAATFLRTIMTSPDTLGLPQIDIDRSRTPIPNDETVVAEPIPPKRRGEQYLAALRNVPRDPLQHDERTYDFLKSRFSGLIVGPAIYRALLQWINGSSLPCLWIQGPYGCAFPSQNDLTAASLVQQASESRNAVIYHFVQMPTSRADLKTYRRDSLLRMVQSLILQLLPKIDEKRLEAAELSPAWATLLSSSTHHSKDMVEILRDLIQLRTATLICVINGLYLLDDYADSEQSQLLESLVDAIAPEDAIAAEISLKTCFTTDGHSDVLSKLVRAERTAKADFDIPADEDEEEDNAPINDIVVPSS